MGHIEDVSFFEFAGTRFAGKTVAVSEAFAVVEPGDLTARFRVELMHRVVAQIQSQENNLGKYEHSPARV